MRILLALFTAALLGLAGGAATAQTVLGFDFRSDTAPWVAFGDGTHLQRTTRPAGLSFRYRLGAGQIGLLTLPIERGALAGVQSLRFVARPDAAVSLVVTLEEQGGGRWTANIALPAQRDSEVWLRVSDFVLSRDADAPRDPNGRLDMDRVRLLGMVDAAAFIAAQNAKAVEFFSLAAGERRLELRDVAFLRNSPERRDDPAAVLAGLDGSLPRWMVFGAERAEMTTGGPLRIPGLLLEYERKWGRALSAIRMIPAGALAGAKGVTLQLASSESAEVSVTLEQVDGAKFAATLKLPDGSSLRSYAVDGDDFKRADDSRTRADRPDWAQVSQIGLLEAGGLLGPRGRNQLWLAGVAGEGQAPGSAASSAAANRGLPIEAASVEVRTPGWSAWKKNIRAIHSGKFALVGDPSVMRDGDILRMVYNCFDPDRKRGAICQATSTDGFDWADIDTGDKLRGRLIKTRPGQWDDAHETPFLYRHEVQGKPEYLLYFVGYRDRGGFMKSFPAYVGMATSTDGRQFERGDTEPVLRTTPGGHDNDAISSPSVVSYQGQLVMLYTGHCWTNCPRGKGVTLLAATSDDGRNWTKRAQPVLTKADFPHAQDGIAEAEVDLGPDGRYYLFYSLLYGDNGHEIGVASAPTPFGPWRINTQPVVRKSTSGFDDIGPIAPTVVFDGDRVRMWFHGFSKRRTIEIGYAEAPWPLMKP